MDNSTEIKKTDFLIIGSGIAGLYTALKLSTIGKVIILTKEQLEDSNTQFAQGGIAAVLDKGDSWELHMKDTLKAGAGLCNRKAVEVLVTEGPGRVKELIRLGTSFDHIEGELDLTKEGAHSRRRILHARGDATGVEIRESLSKVIEDNENISLMENTFMLELLYGSNTVEKNIVEQDKKGKCSDILNMTGKPITRQNKRISGILARRENKYIIFQARAIVLASGGCSRVYSHTSNPPVTTGDGIAAAYRAGVDIMDMEFIQFHPTTFYNPEGKAFLISESVRGEGAVLRNKDGKRFMPEYHYLADLAPRDIVARAIVDQAKQDNQPYVYLDVTELEDDYIVNRFPTIFKTLKKAGYDMRKELIPVVPAAHYLMGGVRTDTYGRTSHRGLYACGEVACTGVHGANRLASNSLLEGLVFGHRIYSMIKCEVEEEQLIEKKYISTINRNSFLKPADLSECQIDIDELCEEFRLNMTKNAGIQRDEESLKDIINWIDKKLKMIEKIKYFNQKLAELRNMLINGKMIARASLLREESRGGHYRSDFIESEKNWLNKHILFNYNYPEGGEYELE